MHGCTTAEESLPLGTTQTSSRFGALERPRPSRYWWVSTVNTASEEHASDSPGHASRGLDRGDF